MGNNAQAFQEYQTPPDFFKKLDDEFHFTLDAAASHDNALVTEYCTPDGTFQTIGYKDYDILSDDDGLNLSWSGWRVFCNPPYARWELFKWIEKAAQFEADIAVLLVPNSTETKWFHTYCWDDEKDCSRPGVKVKLLPGRIRFIDPRNKAKSFKGWRPLSGNMLLIFDKELKHG